MSDLQKQIAKKKGKPPIAPDFNAGDEGDEEEESKDTMQMDIEKPPIPGRTGGPVRVDHNIQAMKPGIPKSGGGSKKTNFDVVDWNGYFDKMEYLSDGTSVFLAGGEEGPLFICLHGAGHSALSFACLAKELKGFSSVAAFDFKGHGYSKYDKDLDDFSAAKLVDESINVFKELAKMLPKLQFIIVGHSMGGSIATKAVEKALKDDAIAHKIGGMVIIDVVEGSAMEALPFMENIVLTRPQAFKTLPDAVQWINKTHTVRNLESAKVSTPTQFTEVKNAAGEVEKYIWKVDLLKSQKFWTDWFKGLTESFLNSRISKLLILAEKDRMDKELTIAQMQGKFKLEVYHNVGHLVQEDDPVATAKSLYWMIDKFKIPRTSEEIELKNTIGVGKFHPALKKAPWPGM